MPPPRYRPAVARVRRARLPAAVPSAETNRSRASTQAPQPPSSAAAVMAAGRRSGSSGSLRLTHRVDRCVKVWRLTRPGPETTSSSATRSCRAESTATSSSSRGLRAAKSVCPPSEGTGISRSPTAWRPASPRPVPGAISAAFPPATGVPGWMTANSWAASSGTAQAHRLEVVEQADGRDAQTAADLGAVDHPRHVGQCRDVGAHRAGDAETGCHDLARCAGPVEEARDHWRQGVELQRRVAPGLEQRRAGSVERKQTQPRLRAADVSREDHPRHRRAPYRSCARRAPT